MKYLSIIILIIIATIHKPAGKDVLINFQDNVHSQLFKTTAGADHFYADNTYQNWKAILSVNSANDTAYILRQPIFKMVEPRNPKTAPRADVTGIWHDQGDTLPKHCNNIIIVKYE